MNYEGYIIRPPSEANSILLQVTLGCSHNKCTFCGTYRDKRFDIKNEDIIFDDIEFARANFKHRNRVFLCDGDALVIPQKRLVRILNQINDRLPWIERVGLYANTKSIGLKTDEELKQLYDLGIKIVYMGLESGDDTILKQIQKGANASTMIKMGKRIKSAGMLLSLTILLGLAGENGSATHAKETGRVLSSIDPDFVGALSLMLVPGSELYDQNQQGQSNIISARNMLKELKMILENTTLSNGLFHANHASNYLPIRAKLPEEKEKTLELLTQALNGDVALKPEHMRAL